MTKLYIPLVAFFLLLLVTVPFSFDFAVSVVPGWHTTILPPFYIRSIILTVVFLFSIIGYWLIIRKAGKLHFTLFVAHFMLTFATVIFFHYPMMFAGSHSTLTDDLMQTAMQRAKLLEVATIIFVAAQALFIVYFISVMMKKNSSN